MAVDKNKHLDCVITSHRLQKEQSLLDKHISKKNEIKQVLTDEYGTKLYGTFNSGSRAKHTAINIKFDFDLIAPFKRNAFATLENMFNDVYSFLKKKYDNGAYVERQRVSIKVEFFADDENDIVRIDVVPGRELNQDKYPDDEDLNLYVFSQFGKISAGSERIKTNPKAQTANVKDHSEKNSLRHNIKLLKVWKVKNSKKPKSFFLELITIKAFDKKDISGEKWDELKAVMEYIRDNVTTISLPDPGNPNNDVADTLTDIEKESVKSDMTNMIDRIEENSDYIEIYFPINSKFPCDEEKQQQNYNIKREGLSVPPVKTRFG